MGKAFFFGEKTPGRCCILVQALLIGCSLAFSKTSVVNNKDIQAKAMKELYRIATVRDIPRIAMKKEQYLL